jgi:1-acyl-sn-glycerol-3-phosphate acyltransferase
MIATALASVSRLVAGATVEWHCDPYGEAQRIYYGNHASHLDFIVIWSSLPPAMRRFARPVAGRDYWEEGTIRRYLASRVFRAVLIDRRPEGAERSRGDARAAVERMAREMGRRDSLIVFPEGTRSLMGEVGPFKSGLYHLSRARPDVELVPVYLENLNRILPKGESLPVPMLSRVTFGPALPTPADEDKDAFLIRARDALLDLAPAA